MHGESVLYQGRLVEKEFFRAFVYSRDGTTKLANSWDEFLYLIGTGLWHASLEDVKKLESPTISVRVNQRKAEVPLSLSNKKRRNS